MKRRRQIVQTVVKVYGKCTIWPAAETKNLSSQSRLSCSVSLLLFEYIWRFPLPVSCDIWVALHHVIYDMIKWMVGWHEGYRAFYLGFRFTLVVGLQTFQQHMHSARVLWLRQGHARGAHRPLRDCCWTLLQLWRSAINVRGAPVWAPCHRTKVGPTHINERAQS